MRGLDQAPLSWNARALIVKRNELYSCSVLACLSLTRLKERGLAMRSHFSTQLTLTHLRLF